MKNLLAGLGMTVLILGAIYVAVRIAQISTFSDFLIFIVGFVIWAVSYLVMCELKKGE